MSEENNDLEEIPKASEYDGRVERHELQINRWTTIHSTGGSISGYEIQDKPDAVTEQLADAIWMEESIDVETKGIEVVRDD